MKKVIKLTESDLARIVRRVIREQETQSSQTTQNVNQNQTMATPGAVTINGRSYKLPGVNNAERLKTFLTWHSGDHTNIGGIISTLESNGMKIPAEWKGFESQLQQTGNLSKNNVVSRMSNFVQKLLETGAIMGIANSKDLLNSWSNFTTVAGNLFGKGSTSPNVDASGKTIPSDQDYTIGTELKTYLSNENFKEVFSKIYQTQINRLG
jgi:hypothetical protein